MGHQHHPLRQPSRSNDSAGAGQRGAKRAHQQPGDPLRSPSRIRGEHGGDPRRGGVLTPGEGPGQQGDVVSPAPRPSVQVVPELVVGGEINDGGWHSHDPAKEEGCECPPWGLAGGLGQMPTCPGRR